MIMKLGHVEIFSEDIDRARAFYIDILGFDIIAEQEEMYLWLQKEKFEILIRPGQNSQPGSTYQETNVGFVFYTDDLEYTKKELESRGLVFSGTDGGDACLVFKDPDGNWFQLVNPEDH